MEDISEFFVLPAVIDIKVGQRTYGPDANEEKRRKETEKYPQQVKIFFRLYHSLVCYNSFPHAISPIIETICQMMTAIGKGAGKRRFRRFHSALFFLRVQEKRWFSPPVLALLTNQITIFRKKSDSEFLVTKSRVARR